MGKFNQYLGKTEMTVDGQKLELDVGLKEMGKIMTASKKGVTETSLEEMANIFKSIMKRNYPDQPEEEINAFVEKKIMTFLKEFSIAMGWTTRKEIEDSFREAGKSQQSGKKA